MNTKKFFQIDVKAAEGKQLMVSTLVDTEIDIAAQFYIPSGVGVEKEHPLHTVALCNFANDFFDFLNGENPFHECTSSLM